MYLFFYTAICRATSKSAKMASIVWISWNKMMICLVHMHTERKDSFRKCLVQIAYM